MKESNPPAIFWDHIIRNFSNAHLLQTWEWGNIKAQFGWKPLYALWKRNGSLSILTDDDLSQISSQQNQVDISLELNAAALILQRSIPIRGFARRMSVLYAPKGPLLDWEDRALSQRVITDIQTLAKQYHAIFIKIDPDVRLGIGIPGSSQDMPDKVGISLLEQLQSNHWHFSDEQVQFRNTCLISLTNDETVLLASMKQKTRYNIRLAERKGVTIRYGSQSDIPLLYRMYTETSQRDGFIIREEDYYRTVLNTFLSNPLTHAQNLPTVQPIIAEVEGEPIAAVVIFMFAGKAWYFYGMSREIHRDKMPNYLLQWEAIRLAKRMGCKIYDLWGAPDQFTETNSMWGVYRFKEGLGGHVIRHIGAWDYPVQPFLYRLYTQTLPHFLHVMRKRQRDTLKEL